VEFSPDYGTAFPLHADDEDLRVIPGSLLDRIWEWKRFFDEKFDPDHEGGWESVPDREWWSNEADEIAAELRAVLPPEIELNVDLWPLNPA
jgi:hypothetical protein